MEASSCKLVCDDVNRVLPQKTSAPLCLLNHISFTVDSGETLTILGPSGAGKSTLLRMLNRLDEPTSGTILLDGVDTSTISPRQLRRRVGMVMQRAFLFPGTVAENVRFGPAQAGRFLAEAEIAALLSQVGIPGYSARNALTLSGGEAQRVALARALANGPEVLLLDEPTSALDEVSRHTIEELLLSVVRGEGLTCVWVTHDRAQARRVGNRALLLERGTIRAQGDIDQVLNA